MNREEINELEIGLANSRSNNYSAFNNLMWNDDRFIEILFKQNF